MRRPCPTRIRAGSPSDRTFNRPHTNKRPRQTKPTLQESSVLSFQLSEVPAASAGAKRSHRSPGNPRRPASEPSCLRASFFSNEPKAARVLSHQFSVTSGQRPAAYTARPIQPPRAGRRSSPRPNRRDNRRQTNPSAPPTRIATFPATPFVPTCLRACLHSKRSHREPCLETAPRWQAFVPPCLRPSVYSKRTHRTPEICVNLRNLRIAPISSHLSTFFSLSPSAPFCGTNPPQPHASPTTSPTPRQAFVPLSPSFPPLSHPAATPAAFGIGVIG